MFLTICINFLLYFPSSWRTFSFVLDLFGPSVLHNPRPNWVHFVLRTEPPKRTFGEPPPPPIWYKTTVCPPSYRQHVLFTLLAQTILLFCSIFFSPAIHELFLKMSLCQHVFMMISMYVYSPQQTIFFFTNSFCHILLSKVVLYIKNPILISIHL